MFKNLQRTFLLSCFLLLLFAFKSFGAVEPYENFIKGQISINDSLIVKDEKFRNPAYNWANISNISVRNSITLRILDEQAISQNFSCEADLRILYFSSPGQQQPTEIQSVKLHVNYSKEQGASYKISDSYNFLNGYYVKVYISNITSPQYGSTLPPVMQLSSNIIIDRQYLFRPEVPVRTTGVLVQGAGSSANNRLQLSWPITEGAEEYDIEWATVDSLSEWWNLADSMKNIQEVISPGRLNKLFRNNATRITTHDNNYTISLLFNAVYLAVRIRQVQYKAGSGLRMEGDWSYELEEPANKYAIWPLSWHEPGLNWQYSSAFAEEGKKKETISYFDGTLRGRQTATLNSTDSVALVQENIYDEFGRQAASILPAPVRESGIQYLHYFRDFNLDSIGKPYSFADINTTCCELIPGKLNTSSGASNYYSANNQFLNLPLNQFKNFTRYIPDAKGYPLSLTQYTPDNTGRIKLQGGVGPDFQPGRNLPSRTTKYYYGKPEQWELDKLFGSDAGYASHYLKNMVLDPNGQISVSYLNASGKTVATALTGSAPANLDALNSVPATHTQNTHLLRPEQFVFDATALKLSANTTYLSSVKGPAVISYNMQKLLHTYTEGPFHPCSNCFYELSVTVKDDCNTPVYTSTQTVKIGSDTSDPNAGGTYSATINLDSLGIGEYYINFDFTLSRNVIDKYTDNFITQGQEAGAIQKEFSFLETYLKESDFSGAFSDCTTCIEKLGTQVAFTAMFKTKLTELQADSAGIASGGFNIWLDSLYTSLKTNCILLQQTCYTASSPCEEFEKLMLEDVSPGGQYALLDTDGEVLEPELNVLLHWRDEFLVAAPGSSSFNSELITLEDGNISSPYAAGFTLGMLVKYWKPEWAQKFLKYHPEYCKLLSCNTYSPSLNWDNLLKERIVLAADIASIPGAPNLNYDRANPDWLLAADPFFKNGAPGAGYKAEMLQNLVSYSSTYLHVTAPGAQVKSITGFVDYTLYCANSNAWNNCSVIDSCRVPDREWQQYRDNYLEIKEKYYKKLRDSVCSGTCVVGTPITLAAGGTLAVSDFNVETYSGAAEPCSPSQQKIKVVYTAGVLSKSATVQLYYPGQNTLLNVQFAIGDAEKLICVPARLPLNSIGVGGVTVNSSNEQ